MSAFVPERVPSSTRLSQSIRSPLKQQAQQQQSRSETRQKSIIMKIQESLTKHKTLNQANPQSMKRLQSEAHTKHLSENTAIVDITKQKQRESEFISTRKKIEAQQQLLLSQQPPNIQLASASTTVTASTATTQSSSAQSQGTASSNYASGSAVSALSAKQKQQQQQNAAAAAAAAQSQRDPVQLAQIESDYTYVMSFMVNQIEAMRKNIESAGLTEEIRLIFPTREKLERTWEEQHPQELCTILSDYVRFFVRMNQDLMATKQQDFAKFDVHDEKQLILHSVELEKLQFDKKEIEYLFTIEQLVKRRDELEQKLMFMERHCSEAIRFLTNDNSELVNLVKDKDVVMDKIQEQIEIKNEHIRSQDQKLLSVLIYEFKLRKVDIRYQAQILKTMKHHSSDLEKYYDMLESCWRGLNKCGNSDVVDQFNYVKAYVQGIKNDLFNQIINIQSKQEKYFDNFNDKKKNFHQLNEVQDKIQENQLFQNEPESMKKTQSKFSKVNFAQQIQMNIISNANVTKKHRKQVRSIKDVQFVLDEQQFTNQSPVPNSTQSTSAGFNTVGSAQIRGSSSGGGGAGGNAPVNPGAFSTMSRSAKNFDIFNESETSPTKYLNSKAVLSKNRVGSSTNPVRASAGFLSTTSTATQLPFHQKQASSKSFSKNNSILMGIGVGSAQNIRTPLNYL